MALATADLFAAFDVTDGAQERDISPILEDAIYYDLNLLGSANVAFDQPVDDIIHYWNEEELNADTVTLGASLASDGTAITLTTAHGNRIHVGDLLYNLASAGQEVMQATATGADAVTVTRAYNSTTAVSLASTGTLAVIRAEQEGSDIGTDRTLNPTVRNNHTQIFSAYDLKISGSQLARRMATDAYRDFLARQLAARAIEMKIGLSRAFLYAEKSSSTGSDTVYRTFAGLRNWNRGSSGVINSTSEALAYANINAVNKSIVDKGVFPDRLVIGTDLVGSVAGIDSTVRRLRESDKQVGYVVQEVLLNQGNMVQVVVDARVKTGDAWLYSNEKVKLRPMAGRGMFVIAATDFADAKKRRILGEWTMEVRNPQATGQLHTKT